MKTTIDSQLAEILVLNVCAMVQAYIVNPISPWPYPPDLKKKKFNKFCGKEARVLLYMYVKYRILTKYFHGVLANFLRGILAFHKNDKSFAREFKRQNKKDITKST